MSREDILRNEDLTFAEKIINLKNVERNAKILRAGEIAVVNVDVTLGQDSTTPLAILTLEEMGIKRLWDPSKVFFFIDHTYPAADENVANMHKMMREFAAKYKCNIIEGSISHQYMFEEVIVPGMMLIGADSHTIMGGTLGAFATGVGSTEIASIWACGKTWLKIPESVLVIAKGELKKGVYSKDLILHFIGMIGEEGAAYKSIEWKGDTIDKMTIHSRAVLCNMGIEAGAKSAVIEVDHVTRDYLASVDRKPMYEIHSGSKADYEEKIEIESDKLEPLVSAPNNVDNVKHIREVEGVPIDQAFVGSTTNARLEDLEIVAKMIKGKRVKNGTRFIVTPASRKIYDDAIKLGLAYIFAEAGAVFTNATCGACVGTHLGVLANDEVCISSTNRNFIGRMGANSAKFYLASPATVTASAIEGKITDPRRYL